MIEWLLARPELFPIIVITISGTVAVGRFLFAAKSDVTRLKTQVEDLRSVDQNRGNSMRAAHVKIDKHNAEINKRIDDWIREWERDRRPSHKDSVERIQKGDQ